MGKKEACFAADKAYADLSRLSAQDTNIGGGSVEAACVQKERKVLKNSSKQQQREKREKNRERDARANEPITTTTCFSDSVNMKDYPGRIVLPQALYKS
jgi:hypothetical protein